MKTKEYSLALIRKLEELLGEKKPKTKEGRTQVSVWQL